MNQSRFMSLVESVANVIVGYGVAVMTQTPPTTSAIHAHFIHH